MKLMAENQFTPADNNEVKSLNSQAAKTADTLKDGLFSKEKTPSDKEIHVISAHEFEHAETNLDKGDKPDNSKSDFSNIPYYFPEGVFIELPNTPGILRNDKGIELDPSKIELDHQRLQVGNLEKKLDGTTIAHADDGRILVVNPDGSKIEFDREHRISKVQLAPTDKNEQPKIREFSYNGNTLSAVKESNGTNLKLEGSEWTIRDKDKQQAKLELSVKLSDNGELSFHKGNELVSKLRLDGSVLSYDQRGNVISVVYPDNRLRTFKYDDNNNVIAVNSKTSESFSRVAGAENKFLITPAENQTRQVKDPRTGKVIEQPIPPWSVNLSDIRVDKETGEFRWIFTNGEEKHVYSNGQFSEVKVEQPTAGNKAKASFDRVQTDDQGRVCKITGMTSEKKLLVTTVKYISPNAYYLTIPDAHSDNVTRISTTNNGKSCTLETLTAEGKLIKKEISANLTIDPANGNIGFDTINGKSKLMYTPNGAILDSSADNSRTSLLGSDNSLTIVRRNGNYVVSYERLGALADLAIRGIRGNEGTNKLHIHRDAVTRSANLGMMAWNLRSGGGNELIRAWYNEAIRQQKAAGISSAEPNGFEKLFFGWNSREDKARLKPSFESRGYKGTILDPAYQRNLSNVLTEQERFPHRKNASNAKSEIRQKLEIALKTFDIQEDLAKKKTYATTIELFKHNIDSVSPSMILNFTDVLNQAGEKGLQRAISYYQRHPAGSEEERIKKAVVNGVSYRMHAAERYQHLKDLLARERICIARTFGAGKVRIRELVTFKPRVSKEGRIANNR